MDFWNGIFNGHGNIFFGDVRGSACAAIIDEDDAVVVTFGVDPTDQGGGFADVGLAEFVAVVSAVGHDGWLRDEWALRWFCENLLDGFEGLGVTAVGGFSAKQAPNIRHC